MRNDPWTKLRKHTTARIALGRAGTSLPTAELLAFAADHAEARDAVHSAFDVGKVSGAIGGLGLEVLTLRTAAENREAYLKNPDLGRKLNETSAAMVLEKGAQTSGVDVALIVGDGLSAVAGERHAGAVLGHLVPKLQAKGFSIGPVCVVSGARVAVEDQIGALLKAKVAVILIGERPGLGTADRLGTYLVFEPGAGKTDADRNCVSNIRPGSLGPPAAAATIAWLIEQALVRRISGVKLKDERDPAALVEKKSERTIAIHRDSHFTFRFVDDRIIPRIHLEGAVKGRRVSLIWIDAKSGERKGNLVDATVGEEGWVELREAIVVRAGEEFIAVVE